MSPSSPPSKPGVEAPRRGEGVLRRYRHLLPITDNTPMITLGEGDTPLVRSVRLERDAGCDALYFKLESCNPSGSFKDRGMVVAVAKAVERGDRAVLCASTGNTSASAAAYAAHCGLQAYVIVPHGRIAEGKLAQTVAHGARIIAVDGSFDDALRLAREVPARHPIALVNSVNPHRIEGQKTAAFEIVDVLGDAPDVLCLPVGNAGNITANWRGAIGARDESGGDIGAVSDEEILSAYRRLAQEEGIFCEPASAAGVAGLLKAAREGATLAGRTVVCIITGTG